MLVSPAAAENYSEAANAVEAVFEGLSEQQAATLSDGQYLTVYKGDKLTVSAKEKFRAVYIIWNVIPDPYTVSVNGKAESFEGDFLHKSIKLEEPADRLEISCEKEEEICDIYLFSDPDLPDFVQQWDAPCKQADMLVLSAHADDEYLMFGGTIPYYAKERGLRVQVAYLTAHPDEQPRPHELLDGLWTAGVKNYPVIGIINDIPASPIWTIGEAASLYDLEAVLEWFAEQLRRFKPSVLVTHDINGEYGHGAHKLAAKTAVEAVELAGDAENYPDSAEKYGVWDVPKTYLHFWQENTVEMDWEIPLESFGGITAREAAELCYACHKSQHKYGYSVGYAEKWDCSRFGLYRSLVGEDTEADFMDNITPLPREEEAEETEEQTAAAASELAAETALTSEEHTAAEVTAASTVDTPIFTEADGGGDGKV
ncbi:MAG: PIG-L family deacetylase, partial [[Eubacterium] siraeum]|nr:PIG-L family deacetylase [[Eubacterium] siraeum]